MSSAAPKKYLLELIDGQTWIFSATNEIANWAQKFSAILELTPYNDEKCGHQLLVCGKTDLSPNQLAKKSQLDLVAVKIFYEKNINEAICVIKPGSDELLKTICMDLILQPVIINTILLGGLPLHAALIEKNGKGVLLAARGGTGKSTCCQRLPLPWTNWCDDKTLIVDSKDRGYFAHPLPTWSDHLLKRSFGTWKVSKSIRVAAICFLEQAEKDELIALGKGEAATCAHESARQGLNRIVEKFKGIPVKFKLFDNACKLVDKIPAYKFKVSKEGKFWEELEKILPANPII